MIVACGSQTKWAAPTIYAEKAYGLALTEGTQRIWTYYSDPKGLWHLALILTPLQGGGYEASSPYGYSGMFADKSLTNEQIALLWEETLRKLKDDGVISLFLRFPSYLYEGHNASRFSGLNRLDLELVSTTIEVHTDENSDIWSSMEGRARTAVRKAWKMGMSAYIGPCSTVSTESMASFRDLYEATMVRIGSAAKHIYDDGYYNHLVSGLRERLQVVNVKDSSGKPAAAALLMLDREVVHYHLSGSDPSAARNGANNLLLWTILEWAHGNGYKSVHLGGGLKAGDSLFKFKRSFGGTARDFCIGRVIVNEQKYEELTRAHAEKLGISLDECRARRYFPAFSGDEIQ